MVVVYHKKTQLTLLILIWQSLANSTYPALFSQNRIILGSIYPIAVLQ